MKRGSRHKPRGKSENMARFWSTGVLEWWVSDCRVPSDSEHGISESKMAIGRRENLPGGRDGQTESMERREALPDCERGAEPKGASGANWPTASGLRRVNLSVAG